MMQIKNQVKKAKHTVEGRAKVDVLHMQSDVVEIDDFHGLIVGRSALASIPRQVKGVRARPVRLDDRPVNKSLGLRSGLASIIWSF